MSLENVSLISDKLQFIKKAQDSSRIQIPKLCYNKHVGCVYLTKNVTTQNNS